MGNSPERECVLSDFDWRLRGKPRSELRVGVGGVAET